MSDGIDIVYQLKRLGVSQTEIARTLGVRQGVVSNVIHNKASAHAVATYIAQLLNSTPQTLWPQRYCFKPRRTSISHPNSNMPDLAAAKYGGER